MRFSGILAGLLLGMLASCGGGGGAGSSGPSASLQSGTVTLNSVERDSTTADLAVNVSGLQDGASVYFVLEGGDSLLSDVESNGEDFSDAAHFTLTLRRDLSIGEHHEDVKMHVCYDDQCNKELHGSPLALALRATILPNISVPALIELSRTGAEAAPSRTVSIDVPAAAGSILLEQTQTANGLSMSYADGAIQITTSQLKAGVYEATAHLDAGNPLYGADFTVRYTVNPPVGGEHAMSVSPQNITFALAQGDVKTQQIIVTRPTWTDDYTPLMLSSGCALIYSLTDLGNYNYRLTANATGEPVRAQEDCTLVASAGSLASASVSVHGNVGLAFNVDAGQSFDISRDTTSASLTQARAVRMSDDSALSWSATTTAPWLRLTRSHGTTGVDALALQVDPTHLADYLPGATAHVSVSVGRPNVPPQDVVVGLAFSGPYLQDAWAKPLSGGRMKLYVPGLFDYNVVSNGSVQVSGAHVQNIGSVMDNFFLGNITVLQITVDQVVPGQPITVSFATPYLTTQAQVPVPSTPAYGNGYVALPYGLRKPPSFSSVNGALYFAGADSIWRYAASGSTWSLSSVSAPGVIDVDPRPDEAHLLAVSVNGLSMLDPTSLQAIWSGVPVNEYFGSPVLVTGATESDSKSIAHTSDGYAWVTYLLPSRTGFYSAGVGELSLGFLDTVAPSAGVVNESRGEYAAALPDASVGASWMAISAGRQTVLATSSSAPNGVALLGDSMSRVNLNLLNGNGGSSAKFPFPFPVPPAGIDNTAQNALRSDGRLWEAQNGAFGVVDLNQVLSPGQTAGGWSLTGDGRYGLVYTYQLSGSGDSATAGSPTLHVIQLVDSNTGARGTPVDIASYPLSGPVGCGTPRAAGESCVHTAHILVDPTGAVAFVVGPRGVAAVSLSPSIATQLSVHGVSIRKAGSVHALKARMVSAP